MPEGQPQEQPQINPAIMLASKLIEEMVLLRKTLTDHRESVEENTKIQDQIAGYLEVVDRTVELMADSQQRPTWNLFLDSWTKAAEEIFGEDDDDDEEGGGDPEPMPRGRPPGLGRKPFVTQG